MATQDNSIIPVTSIKVSGNEEQVVNARDLYNFLSVGRDFSSWLKGRVEEYGFVENQDFGIFPRFGENSRRGRKAVDYFLTLEMAKELAMVEKNDKGREARRYFIECERRAKQPRLDPEFYLVHKSALQDTGAALMTPNEYGTATTRPISPEAMLLLPALSAFIEEAKRSGYLIIRPDQLVQKLIS